MACPPDRYLVDCAGMAALEQLQRDLDRALEAEDHAAAAAVRRTIVDSYADRPEAAEAAFKLGLFSLFKEKNLDAAEAALRTAAKAKHPVWSPQARISLGVVSSCMGAD